MHNKLLVADDQRAIFGGRNIAAEHFGLGTMFNLVDYDLQLTGTEASDLSRAFDTYWDNPASVAGSALDQAVSDVDLIAVRDLVAAELEKWTMTLSSVSAGRDTWDRQVDSKAIAVSEGAVSVVSDAPGVSQDTQPTQVIAALRRAGNSAERDLVIVTPFFVPNEIDVGWYEGLVDRGVRIRILTNSLASNQGTISNSGLNRQRLAVVKAGVELHELRTDAGAKSEWETSPQIASYLGLHAKLYAIDGKRVFVGSVNLDPRSKFINTEIGVLIESTELTERTVDVFARLMTTENAWRVEIGADNRLQWRNDTETSRRQPARSAGQRLADTLLALLPIRDYI
jgi:putative cardiolipin synthase